MEGFAPSRRARAISSVYLSCSKKLRLRDTVVELPGSAGWMMNAGVADGCSSDFQPGMGDCSFGLEVTFNGNKH